MTIQEQSEFTELQSRIDKLTEKVLQKDADLDQARRLAAKYRDLYLSTYEDSGFYIIAYSQEKLPWEK